MILSPILFIIAGLAVARITSLLVHDTILDRVRHEVFLISPPPDDLDEGREYQYLDRIPFHQRRPGCITSKSRWSGGHSCSARRVGFIGSALACSHCTAVWVAGAVYASLELVPGHALPVLVIAALAQVSEATIKASR